MALFMPAEEPIPHILLCPQYSVIVNSSAVNDSWMMIGGGDSKPSLRSKIVSVIRCECPS